MNRLNPWCFLLLPCWVACANGVPAATDPAPSGSPSVAVGSSDPNGSDANVLGPGTPNETVTPVATEPNAPDPDPDPDHPAAGPTVRTIGRFAPADANGVVAFSWPATTMLTRVLGTGVDIELTSGGNEIYQGQSVSSFFDAYVDDDLVATFALQPGVTRYAVAQNLSFGDHIVRVAKRTEPQMGYASFAGFVATGNGTLLPAPLARARKIEFVGDSITAGYGAEGNVATYAECPNFTIGTENAGRTFASMTAEHFGADYSVVAWSGKGVVQNDDCFGDPTYTLPRLYAGAAPQANGASWDFSGWIPQAVVINLGTNDYNMANGCGIPSDANFQQGWVDFVRVVRGHYPEAYVLCTVGPEVPTVNRPRATANVQAAVATLRDAGDAQVGYVALAPDTGANGYGCGGHPNQTTHGIMAQAVIEALSTALGW